MRSPVRYGITVIVVSFCSLFLLSTLMRSAKRQICIINEEGGLLAPFFADSSEPRLSSLVNRSSEPDIFRNALVAGNPNAGKGYLTLGIPTIRRQKGHSYLVETIQNLIDNANDAEKNEIRILVFLGDIEEAAKAEVKTLLLDRFNSFLEKGLLLIIQAPKEFYPSFDNLPRTYKHTAGKVRWRSKQNYDYAYMMLYAKQLSDYYIQLEDDLTTIQGYLGVIKQFIGQNKRSWTCLEFSALGFIGKLYHSYDLEKLAKLLILFFYEQPNDVTYTFFNQLKLQEHRIVRKPTIFKHQGLYSSLSEKQEVRKDPLFQDVKTTNETRNVTVTTVLNPPAKLGTNLKIYGNHRLERCYIDRDIMWTYAPQKSSWVIIAFNTPQNLHSVKIATGPDDHPDDFLQHGVLQIGQKGTSSSCTEIFALQKFTFGQVDLTLDEESQSIPAACVQIFVTVAQANWLMISEISVKAIQR